MQLRYIYKIYMQDIYIQNVGQYETDNQNFFQQKQLHQEHLQQMQSKENNI